MPQTKPPNNMLHLTAIPLRFIAASEHGRYTARSHILNIEQKATYQLELQA